MPTTIDRQALWRIALQLQRHYARIEANRAVLSRGPEDRWRQFRHLQHRVALAQKHHLPYAQLVCRLQLDLALQSLMDELQAVRQQLQTHQRSGSLLNVRMLYDELLSLGDEFTHVEGDLSQKYISVQTESLILEGVELGPFEIRLQISELDRPSPYRVIAMEPNPCADDSDTTHPHVRHDSLCEGDGHTAIRQALAEGRLLDFFVLVRQVLRSYNSSSAYRSLEDWEGTPCADCGEIVSDDDRSTCERCGVGVCGTCVTSCAGCGTSLCSTCNQSCAGCSTTHCDRCLSGCADCGLSHCRDCLNDGLCETCGESPSEEQDHVPPATSLLASSPAMAFPSEAITPSANPAVQSDGLGEIPVPA